MKMKILLTATILWVVSTEPETVRSMHVFSDNLAAGNESSSFQVIDGWSIRKVKNGIQVCTRWILTSRNVKTRQVKGVVILRAKRELITRLITDEQLARKWMVFLDELHYYQVSDNPGEWYAYGRINVLGKIACFDVVTNNHVLLGNQVNQTLITMNGIPGYLPNKSGVHRITGLNTSLCLTSVAPDETRIEYMLYSDMAPVVPAWMTDPVVSGLLISALDELRKNAREYALQ